MTKPGKSKKQRSKRTALRPTSRPARPGKVGGTLIRRTIQLLRKADLELPIDSHILCATSAGLDSTALATLLAKYGRRVGARITLLHIHHGWRGKESDQDAEAVTQLAEQLGCGARIERVKPPFGLRGASWEDHARSQRKEVFQRILQEKSEEHGPQALLFTAHHADDLAETLLWRLFTGAISTHGGGIWVRHKNEVRPFLTTRKAELREFLKEEGISWREDSTNQDPRFLRAGMRQKLLPVIEALFPRAVEHLVELGLQAQWAEREGSLPAHADEQNAWSALFQRAGIRARRPHWEKLSASSMDLPGGWKLQKEGKGEAVRWILSRSST